MLIKTENWLRNKDSSGVTTKVNKMESDLYHLAYNLQLSPNIYWKEIRVRIQLVNVIDMLDTRQLAKEIDKLQHVKMQQNYNGNPK